MMEMKLPTIYKVYNANDFVGIKATGKKIDLFLPSFFRIDNDEKILRKDLLLFLKSISLAKTIECSHISNVMSNDISGVWPIESFLWLIQDFIENGVYYDREKLYSSDGKGRIDWKRTMRYVPIISNGNFVYDKIITSKMLPTNDFISQIYSICVMISQNSIGWLWGYNIHNNVQQQKPLLEMISYVKKKSVETFDDVKRLRFRHMLNVLQNINSENALSTRFTYGIENYYYVFEVMVDRLMKGIPVTERKKYNPVGYWKLNGSEEKESSSMRPDTIYINDDELFIIDAKMYQYGFTKNIDDLPETTSMQKQVTYGDYIKRTAGLKKIRNAFIMPYDKTLAAFSKDINICKMVEDNMAFIGEAYVAWRDQKEDYDNIYSFLIDFNFLLNSYKKNDTVCIDQLCKIIDQNIKKKQGMYEDR